MEGSLVLTTAKSLETMSFSQPVTKKIAADPAPEGTVESTPHNSPCEFDWIRTPRAARVRHKYIGNAGSTSASFPRMKIAKMAPNKMRLKKDDDDDDDRSESENEKTTFKAKKRKRDLRGESPIPRSPNFLVGSKRKYVEEWLKSLHAINSTSLDKPFGGWQSDDISPTKDCN